MQNSFSFASINRSASFPTRYLSLGLALPIAGMIVLAAAAGSCLTIPSILSEADCLGACFATCARYWRELKPSLSFATDITYWKSYLENFNTNDTLNGVNTVKLVKAIQKMMMTVNQEEKDEADTRETHTSRRTV